MKIAAISFFSGLIFSAGLILSGMTLPERVIGFLDVFGDWDPTLAFVLIGAVAFHMATYPLITKRKTPILSNEWSIPKKSKITTNLVLGSLLFGMGWGLGGYCPGPGFTAAASLSIRPLLFVGGLLGGMKLYHLTEKVRADKGQEPEKNQPRHPFLKGGRPPLEA